MQRPRNCINKPPSIYPFYHWWVEGALGMDPGFISKERCITINSPKKSEDFFWEKSRFPENCLCVSLRKFQAIFVRKKSVPTPQFLCQKKNFDLNHSCLSTVTSAANNYDGW